MAFKPGFIAPPWPHVRGDSVSAVSLIRRIEEEAARGCGLRYELYMYRALERLAVLLAGLNTADADTVREAFALRGFHLDDDALRHSERAYQNTLNQIRQEQI